MLNLLSLFFYVKIIEIKEFKILLLLLLFFFILITFETCLICGINAYTYGPHKMPVLATFDQ